jgi:hypothetical protein
MVDERSRPALDRERQRTEPTARYDPGSTDGKNDAAIVIGRTFSDRVTGIHITPVGKGGTSPESLDVVVNLGLFPADQPPVVNVSPSALTAATGAALTFTATASDPDGDSLAYLLGFRRRQLRHQWPNRH